MSEDLSRHGKRKENHTQMNWDRIEGQWKQRRGKAVHQWGRMMNDDLAAIAGKYEELVGTLQEKYGIARQEAKMQVDEFKKIVNELRTSNQKLQKELTKAKHEARKQSLKSKTPARKTKSK